MYLILFSNSVEIQLMLQNTIMLWWVCFKTNAIIPIEKLKINEIHQLNDNQQTHSSKAILDNLRGIGGATLSSYIYITVITICYDIKANLSG